MRLALSLICNPDGIMNDADMGLFIEGASKEIPSKSKYEFSWYPKLVLNYFLSKPINGKFSHQVLSHNLVFYYHWYTRGAL